MRERPGHASFTTPTLWTLGPGTDKPFLACTLLGGGELQILTEEGERSGTTASGLKSTGEGILGKGQVGGGAAGGPIGNPGKAFRRKASDADANDETVPFWHPAEETRLAPRTETPTCGAGEDDDGFVQIRRVGIGDAVARNLSRRELV